jgi:hypothetical protein
MSSSTVVRSIVGSLNNGQFQELSGLFCDATKPLYFHMSVDQAVEHREAVLREHTGLLMHLFLATLEKEFDLGRQETQPQTQEQRAPQQVSQLEFGAVTATRIKHYGLRQPSKGLSRQLLRYVDHMVRPINLERAGAKVTQKTAEEHKETFLR